MGETVYLPHRAAKSYSFVIDLSVSGKCDDGRLEFVDFGRSRGCVVGWRPRGSRVRRQTRHPPVEILQSTTATATCRDDGGRRELCFFRHAVQRRHRARAGLARRRPTAFARAHLLRRLFTHRVAEEVGAVNE